MHRTLCLLLLGCLLPIAAGFAQTDGDKPAKSTEAKLPADVLGFEGKVTGTVESVDLEKATLKIKVTKAEAHAEKNKAPKPEALAGMTITVTPLDQKEKDGTPKVDAKAVAYIKGALAGDAVTLDLRSSSKGVVFRLLKVPSAGGK